MTRQTPARMIAKATIGGVATEALMRPRVIVILIKSCSTPRPRPRGAQLRNAATLVINRLDEALDVPIRRGRARPNEPVLDAGTAERLLKPRQPARVKGVAHREQQVVVRHHSFHAIRQPAQDIFQKRRRGARVALVGGLRDGFATKVIDRGVLTFPLGGTRGTPGDQARACGPSPPP
jgi:hypothetical protein